MSSTLRRSSDPNDTHESGNDHVRRHSSLDGDAAEQAGLLRDNEAERQLDDDLEKGVVIQESPPPTQNHEDTVSTKKKLIALAGYFVCNIGLTIYNKAILGSVGSPDHRIYYYPLRSSVDGVLTSPARFV